MLINQHPEKSLNATGMPMPIVIVRTTDMVVLEDEGVADLMDALLNASGLNLEELTKVSSREAMRRFRFTDYGKGSHNSFKSMMTRALSNRTNIRNWYSRWLSRLHPEEHNMRNQFPSTEQFLQRIEEEADEEMNLTELNEYEQYAVPGEDNAGDYIRHDW